MNQILIDTNAYAAYKRGDQDAVTVFERAATIGVSSVVLGELYSGFQVGTREEQNRRELAEFLELPMVTVLPVDQNTALRYASVYSKLRKAGTPIPTNDMWIAATALQHGYDVFSKALVDVAHPEVSSAVS